MYILIGDIGNTITKICLINTNNFKVKKIIYLNSKNIPINTILKKKLKYLIDNENINKYALFSSVVPKYKILLDRFFKKKYNVFIREIKDSKMLRIGK